MRSIALCAALAGACLVAACGKTESTGAAASSAPSPSAAAPAPAPAPTPAASPATSTDASAAPAVSASATGNATASASSGGTTMTAGGTGGAGSGNGPVVYSQTCIACHAAGVAGAPKLGDKEAWGPRIAQGNDTLYKHAIQGFQGRQGVMPAKGGAVALPDADVKAAVDYMVAQGR